MKPNSYGVYVQCECINLPVPKGWHEAEIRLAVDDKDKLWRHSCTYKANNFGGGSFPSKDSRSLFATREDALTDALQKFAARFPECKELIERSTYAHYINGQTSLF